jgi:WD40 repeat protein
MLRADFMGHDPYSIGDVTCCCFSNDGLRVLSGHDDTCLRIWDVESGLIQHTLGDSRGSTPILFCAYSPGGSEILSGDARTLVLWDAINGTVVFSHDVFLDPLTCGCFSPDGKCVVGASGNTLTVWDANNGKLQEAFMDHSSTIQGCSFSGSGNASSCPSPHAILSWDWEDIKLWDCDDGLLLHNLEGHSERIVQCCWHPDGNLVLSAARDHTLKLWSVTTGHCLRTLNANLNFCGFGVVGGGLVIVSCGVNNALQIWDPASGRLKQTLVGNARTQRFSFRAEGKCFVSADSRGALHFWG